MKNLASSRLPLIQRVSPAPNDALPESYECGRLIAIAGQRDYADTPGRQHRWGFTTREPPQDPRQQEAVKNHAPYVVPCLDMSRATIANENELYLHSIPYMQFPLLLAGRPFTGERALIPGVQYPPEEKDFWTTHCRKIWRYYQSHPDGPYSYGMWDSCPGRPEARATYYRWLKLYRPMVEPGTWAYLELVDSDFFKQRLPKNIVASGFANRELYLVLANYSGAEVTVETTRSFLACGKPAAAPGTSWPLAARSLMILKRSPA